MTELLNDDRTAQSWGFIYLGEPMMSLSKVHRGWLLYVGILFSDVLECVVAL